ncbi:MAG: MopE-related protein [Myxococcota bacterium]
MSPNILLLLSSVMSRSALANTSVASLNPGDLIISEMMTNPASSRAAAGEWLEIYNNTDGAVDLNGLQLTGSGTLTINASVVVPAGGYAVLATSDKSWLNGGLPQVDFVYTQSSFPLGNRSGTVTLSHGDTTIDTVAYNLNRGFPAPWGTTMSLDRDFLNASDNDEGYRWCGATTAFGSGDQGTPGAANDLCPVPVVDLVGGELVISEFMTDPATAADKFGEWIEVTNVTARTINLRMLELSSAGDDGLTISGHILIESGQSALFARHASRNANGGLPGVHVALGDAITLDEEDDFAIGYDGVVIDMVSWDSSFPLFEGAAMNLDINHINAGSNDLGRMWCPAADLYNAADYGTPRAENIECLTDADNDGVTAVNDCDDNNPAAHPFAEEICDGVDNDCDGAIDEEVTTTYYADTDGDGFGLASLAIEACAAPEGYAEGSGDCDDTNGAIAPGVEEVCDGIDNDCDGEIDEFVRPRYFADADGDGFGDVETFQNACEQPEGYVANSDDCDDSSALRFPENLEICDGVDNDCDNAVDEFVRPRYFADADGDGFGDDTVTQSACEQPAGYAEVGGDCDDTNRAVSPSAEEVCDEVDNDCDGAIDEFVASLYYEDSDGDGHGNAFSTTNACTVPAGYAESSDDCNDLTAATYPGAVEICDEADNDCDGEIDEGAGDIYYIDRDADGYGDAAAPVQSCEQREGLAQNAADCDDSTSAVSPAAAETCDSIDNDCDGAVDEDASDGQLVYADTDGDGFGDAASAVTSCEALSGYVGDSSDCDDTDGGVYPGAPEVCDGYDNDCDTEVDEGVTSTYYADTDGDGFGDADTVIESCDVPDGYVANGADCDDSSGVAYVGAEEVCDGVDNDCNGEIDEGVGTVWYADVDGDGYGDPAVSVEACEAPDGYVANAADCDDGDAAAYSAAAEICDGVDNDCNGEIDEGVGAIWYADADGDGYGDAAQAVESCEAPAGYVADIGDCDDANGAVYPSAEEVCDGYDNDCDSEIDEGVEAVWYADVDEDGYGDASSLIEACEAPDGYVADDADCDDLQPAINPGMEEICDDMDNDCDDAIDEDVVTTFYADLDGDGFGNVDYAIDSCEPLGIFKEDDGDDCDDSNAAVYPSAEEVCDGADNDCDQEIDEGLTTTYYEDDDGDGFGDAYDAIEACAQPEGYVEDSADCDDRDAEINPSAEEICDAYDNDCDGGVDEGLEVTVEYYIDHDGDGFGDPGSLIESCELPECGYATNDDDCDDSDITINPNAPEICDDVDNDCDNQVDEDLEDCGTVETLRICSDEDGANRALRFEDWSRGEWSDEDGTAAVRTYDDHPAWTATIEGAEWIWSTALVSEPRRSETVYFGRGFNLPSYMAVQQATLEIAADNSYDIVMNGVDIGASSGGNFSKATNYDVTDAIMDGDNFLGIEVVNFASRSDSPYGNPAGLLYCVTVEYIEGDVPTTTWYADADGDGFGDADVTIEAVEAPEGYVADSADCDDTNDTVYPAADEVCDGLDNDCDGAIDEDPVDGGTWYADEDDDGYGDPDNAAEGCEAPPSGYVADASDCDDTDGGIHPAAEEVCDNADNDCDGEVDEGLATTDWYRDEDGDGYGDADDIMAACGQPEGYTDNPADPDDSGEDLTPEVCDGIDNDGDGVIDEALVELDFNEAIDTQLIQFNGDAEQVWAGKDGTLRLTPAQRSQAGTAMVSFPMPSDAWRVEFDFEIHGGSGADGLSLIIIDPEERDLLGGSGGGLGVSGLEGYSVEFDTWRNGNLGDPNENHVALISNKTMTHLAINASIPELEDTGVFHTVIEAVDGELVVTLEDEVVLTTALPDDLPEDIILGLAAGTGAATNNHDVDNLAIGCPVIETDDSTDDGSTDETCAEPELFYRDADGDGHGDPGAVVEACVAPEGYVPSPADCDDQDDTVSFFAEEVCDGVDNDCDGDIDEGVSEYYYGDVDEDGYGDPADAVEGCEAPEGYVSDDTDCDDLQPAVNPGMDEVCDEMDNDCNDAIDDGLLFTAYVDADADGYGDNSLSADICAIQTGYARNGEDCDDRQAAVHPGATEVCNSLDDDCDGGIDEGVTSTFYADADVDSFGDASAAIEACAAPEGYVADSADCDDADGAVFPGAAERCNSLDDDCDGVTDNDLPDDDDSNMADCLEVAVVVTDTGAANALRNRCEGTSALERELGAIEDNLDALGLGMVLVIEDEEVGVSYEDIAPYPVVIYHNMGWSRAGNALTAETLAEAAEMGKGLLMMGDDVAKHAHTFNSRGVPELMDLTAVRRYRNNGRRGQSVEAIESNHPVISGEWGVVSGLRYVADVDQVELKDRGEEPLVYITGTDYPAVWAEQTLTQRTVTMAMGLYTSHDCPLSDEDGLTELDILFQNAVWWLGEY